jgi:hypothetical protein
MDDIADPRHGADAHAHDAHVHGGRVHVHASVDHLAGAVGASARLGIRLDGALMHKLAVAADAVVRVATERGRSILVRLDAPLEADTGTGVVRLDRFVRQALKAHLNESVEIESASAAPVKRIELLPAVDVSMAHDLVPHLKKVLVENRTPASIGAVLYIPFPNSHAGTTYEIHKVSERPGIVDDATEVVLDYHDSHIPDGAFDITFEDVGGLNSKSSWCASWCSCRSNIPMSIAISASIRRAASSFMARPAPARPIWLAQSPTRSTRASTTSTAPT